MATINLPNLTPNVVDKRRRVADLLQQYDTLTRQGWSKEDITWQESYPVVAYFAPATKRATAAFWVQGGIHGEEPASGEAFAKEIRNIGAMGENLPIVLLPLLNPLARERDWRYENEYRDYKKGLSVIACDHLLINDAGHLKSTSPVSPTARAITRWIESTAKMYPPRLVLDHHEDRIPEDSRNLKHRSLRASYVYVSGEGHATSAIGSVIISALKSSGMGMAETGFTRFGEPIKNGLIQNAADGSIDEWYAASSYLDPTTHQPTSKTPADTVVVVETTVPVDKSVSLALRVEAHCAVIRQYPILWQLVSAAKE